VNKIVITVAGAVILLALSSETGILLSTSCQGSQARTRGSLKGLPESPRTVICSLSGTFVNDNDRYLVLWLECRNRYQKGDCLNLQIDLYLYNNLIWRDRTIAKRINFNP